MADAPETFSESWYRIAQQHIGLRPGVTVRRQYFRGERWIVLEDPFSNQFFRLRPEAYDFVARLRPDRTVQEVWQECLDRFPDTAPGQGSVIQLLSQLYFANLLQYDLAADSAQLFERFKKRRQREIRSRFLNIMFMRFPLLDPDRLLVRTLPVIGKLISPIGAVIWLVTVGWALKLVADHFPTLWEESQGILAPTNLFLLYIGLVILKTLHEFGHAFFCRKFGGEVHVMGIMLMIFTPIPYMDATSSWRFRSRWKRMLVGGAGMIVEIFVAAIATFIWAGTGQGIIHSLAYNIMFIASVSTLIFNLNPLLRFDGYYILSDLLEIPNLTQRAGQQLRYFWERYLYGLTKIEPPTRRTKEVCWLVIYGITSWIYRVIIFGGILLVIADRFLLIGILMAFVCAVAWVLVPTGKLIHYLATSPKLDRHRLRAALVTAGLAIFLLVLLEYVPFPSHFRAPGILQAGERTEIVNETAGQLADLLVKPGSRVSQGQPLLKLENHELELELAHTQARLEETEARLLQALKVEIADLQPLYSLRESISNRIQKLQADQAALVVQARHAGIWTAPAMEDSLGRWLVRGTSLGLVLNPESFEFAATVRQEDLNNLFASPPGRAEIRLQGQSGLVLPVQRWKVIPAEQRMLPSAALGWRAGGEVPIALDDPQGRIAAEPFFEVQALVSSASPAPLLHGRSGKIRFDLEPEPILPRCIRRLMQLLQKRYQL